VLRAQGAAIVATLARLAADLTLIRRNEARLREQVAALAKIVGCKAQAVAADIARPEQVSSAFARAAVLFGPLQVLRNNTAFAAAAPIVNTDMSKWK
jgi:NAD(P)-dependent dehydrogenase (short-subunit alcohol dehydrogenase family)